MRHLKRLVAAILPILILAFVRPAVAVEGISVRFDFEFIRQGQVGLISIAGEDLLSATATTMSHDYPCFPTKQGAACLIAAPMDQPIKDYPLSIAAVKKDGTKIPWQSTLAVASGQFIAETLILPGDLLFLLRDDVQANEDARLLDAYSIITPTRYWEGAFTMPLNGVLQSPFGTVRQYNGKVTRRHTGQDMRAANGTPVLASASGQVVLSRPMDIHGNNIVIDHGWGVYSEYAHLSERYVVPGQFVLQGDVIGLSGNTGRSTGPHIHWEIAVNDIWVNPIAFMQIKLPQ